MRKNAIYTSLPVAALLVLIASCVTDALWREHYERTYTVGADITVSPDSVAVISSSPPCPAT